MVLMVMPKEISTSKIIPLDFMIYGLNLLRWFMLKYLLNLFQLFKRFTKNKRLHFYETSSWISATCSNLLNHDPSFFGCVLESYIAKSNVLRPKPSLYKIKCMRMELFMQSIVETKEERCNKYTNLVARATHILLPIV